MNPAAVSAAPHLPVAVSHRVGSWLALCFAFCVPWGDMAPLGDLSLSRWLTVPLAIAWAAVAWHAPLRKTQGAHILMAAFVVWATLGALFTLDIDRSARRVLSYCQLFAQAWVVYQFTCTRRDWHRTLQAFVFGSWIPAVGVFVTWYRGTALGDGRYTASGFDPNDLAGTLALAIPIAAYQAVRFSRWRWMNGVFVACAAAAILLTASRTGLLSLAAATLYPLWIMRKMSWRRRFGMVAVVCLAAASVMYFQNAISFDRLATTWTQVAARDLNGRYEAWIRGSDVLMRHPLVGVGPGAFGTAVASGGGTNVPAHNALLEIAVEHGLIGVALFAGVLVLLFRNLRSLAPVERGLLITLLAIWLLASSALSWENREITWLVWAFCACCRAWWFTDSPLLRPVAQPAALPRRPPKGRDSNRRRAPPRPEASPESEQGGAAARPKSRRVLLR